MNRLTPLILLILVVGLGTLAYRQSEKEQADEEATQVVRLYEDVSMERLRGIRLEYIKGARHVRMERDGGGRWFLTDPLAWPMDQGVLDTFLGVIQRNGAEPVSAKLEEQARSSFEPPLGFLETTEQLEDGTERRVRVELGALDVDGVRMFVRRDGQTFRTLRNIENLFDFVVSEYRSKRLFSFTRGSVAKVERVGGWENATGTQPLGLEAQGFGDRWQVVSPVRAEGDPAVFAAWTSYLTTMRAKRFATDLPGVDLSDYGLDQPWVTLRITNVRGLSQALHVGSKDGRVFARRDEQPTVYELDDETVPFVCEPLENFLELRLARIARTQIASLHFEGSDGALRLSPSLEGWTVAARVGPDQWGTEYAADELVMKDLFTAIEGVEVARSFIDGKVEAFFPAGGEENRFWIQALDGRRSGGRFGVEQAVPGGEAIVPFLRFETGMVQAVTPEFAEILKRPLEAYLSRSLWSQTNTWLRTLEITGAAGTARFERGDGFDWRAAGTEEPARVLDPVLEQLLFLKAEEHLVPGGPALGLEDPVTVTFEDAERRRSVARIGRVGERVLVEVGDLRAVVKSQSLHADLRALLADS